MISKDFLDFVDVGGGPVLKEKFTVSGTDCQKYSLIKDKPSTQIPHFFKSVEFGCKII